MDLSTNDARLALARKYGAKYGLDAALICAVIEQESSWYPWACRYEPGFYLRYVGPLGLQNETESHSRATSFGLMQVLGQVAREHGFTPASLCELCDADTGVDYGCKKLKQVLELHNGNLEGALLAYNGGSNLHYASDVLARRARYETQAEGAD